MKYLILFIPVLAFAQTPYITETVTITNDGNGKPLASVVNAYFGVPSDVSVKTISYDLIAVDGSVTADGITVTYKQLSDLIASASTQNLLSGNVVTSVPASTNLSAATVINNVSTATTSSTISITTNNSTP